MESPKDKMLLRLVWGHFCLLTGKDKAQMKGERGDDNPLSLWMQMCLKLALKVLVTQLYLALCNPPGL